MNPDPIADLLCRADRAAGPVPVAAEDGAFASGVRRRARRRRRVRAGLAASACSVGVVLLLTLTLHKPSTVRTTPSPVAQGEQREPTPNDTFPVQVAQIETARLELARLRDEADRAQAVADRLRRAEVASRQIAQWEQARRAPDPAERLDRRREQAALILVHQADRFDRELGRKGEAAEAYRAAAERFPQTHWASVARDRLRALQS